MSEREAIDDWKAWHRDLAAILETEDDGIFGNGFEESGDE